jgi:peptidoglycan hydrolase CwlO-like protein
MSRRAAMFLENENKKNKLDELEQRQEQLEKDIETVKEKIKNLKILRGKKP